MKSFFKYLLASVVGFFVTFFLIFILMVIIISAVGSKSDKPAEVKPNSILTIKLDREIADRQPEMPFEIPGITDNTPMGLNNILANIQKASKDNNIKGIYIEFSTIAAGNATYEEIRDALAKFKETGKFVVCYGEFYSQAGYYLASVADEVFLNPNGFFYMVGINSTRLYYKNTLEKLGIKATVLKSGPYKSYGEMFNRENMSEPNRQQVSEYINSFWNEWVTKIALSRNITEEKLNEIASGLLIRSNTDAVKFGLVDKLLYKDQVIDALKQRLGVETRKDIPQINLKKYSSVPEQRDYKGIAKEKIAVVYASGAIVMGDGDEENVGSEKYSRTLRNIRKDSTIKAVVLRINSPGGSALASDIIWREVDLTRKVKPVIVSMGDVAASGGYYIASAADTILVNTQTITGSIGVIMTYFNANGLLNKIGIDFDIEKTHAHSDFINGIKDLTSTEYDFLSGYLNTTYDTFLYRVANGRDMNYKQVHNIAQGRVWTGDAAIKNGLADSKSGLTNAITLAAEIAGIQHKYRMVEYPKVDDPFEKFIKSLTGEARTMRLMQELGIDYRRFNLARDIFTNQGMQYAMPYEIITK